MKNALLIFAPIFLSLFLNAQDKPKERPTCDSTVFSGKGFNELVTIAASSSSLTFKNLLINKGYTETEDGTYTIGKGKHKLRKHHFKFETCFDSTKKISGKSITIDKYIDRLGNVQIKITIITTSKEDFDKAQLEIKRIDTVIDAVKSASSTPAEQKYSISYVINYKF